MENACQRKNASCGACCGIFNLKLTPSARLDLLRQRTSEFEKVKLTIAQSIVSYRQRREEKESGIPRAALDVYVCPFYGILEDFRTGCLVHPSRTGMENSQNFSFYGGSICQAYDCVSKEKDATGAYSSFLEQYFPKREEYGRLMSDTLFFSALLKLPLNHELLNSSFGYRETVYCLCLARLGTAASRVSTSFAVSPGRYSSLEEEFEALMYADRDAGAPGHEKLISPEELRRAVRFLMDSVPTEKTFSNDLEGAPFDTAEAGSRQNRGRS